MGSATCRYRSASRYIVLLCLLCVLYIFAKRLLFFGCVACCAINCFLRLTRPTYNTGRAVFVLLQCYAWSKFPSVARFVPFYSIAFGLSENFWWSVGMASQLSNTSVFSGSGQADTALDRREELAWKLWNGSHNDPQAWQCSAFTLYQSPWGMVFGEGFSRRYDTVWARSVCVMLSHFLRGFDLTQLRGRLTWPLSKIVCAYVWLTSSFFLWVCILLHLLFVCVPKKRMYYVWNPRILRTCMAVLRATVPYFEGADSCPEKARHAWAN